MNQLPYHIECILKEKKITDFLSDRNIYSTKSYANKVVYRCPIHAGDNDPSFIVYTNDIYQNYYCYGCGVGGNIINLMSDVDNISLRQAAYNLIQGIDIKEQDVLRSVVKAMNDGIIVDHRQELGSLFLKINRVCYNYLKDIDFDKQEFLFFEQIFGKIDEIVKNKNMSLLEQIYIFLTNRGIHLRKIRYFKEKEKKIIEMSLES